MIKERLPIVLCAILCLLAGIWSGLNRIGWDLPVSLMTAHHGAIMVGGFLGTLISLEKIIPLKKKPLYAIPILSALSVFFFLTGHPVRAMYVLVGSSIALSLVFAYYFRVQRTIIYVLMLLGSLSWLVGNILVLTKSFYPLAFPWWTAFALFIIAAERLELMAFLPVSKFAKRVFISLLPVYIAGAVFSFHGTGSVICGTVLIAAAVWLMRNDVIAINLKKTGLPRFVAIALLAGYIALLFSGIMFVIPSDHWLNYDAIVHSFFLGFVFSMIFAHGPMILPGVMGISASPYHAMLYFWLGLLQASWLLRVFADFDTELGLRKMTGLLNAAAILGYFMTMGVLMIRSRSNVRLH